MYNLYRVLCVLFVRVSCTVCTGCSVYSLYRVLCVLFVRVSCVQFVGGALCTVCTGYLLENSRVITCSG